MCAAGRSYGHTLCGGQFAGPAAGHYLQIDNFRYRNCKIIAPQSIAIGVAAIGVAGRGSESQLLALAMKIYLPFILLLGCLVYIGRIWL
ncbi:MAG: hypothetical protein E7202_12405 [Selenomonas ruminantium]|jgi:hypothetical protein|nr:hypothetical protein [Selenomonas ruminantium]